MADERKLWRDMNAEERAEYLANRKSDPAYAEQQAARDERKVARRKRREEVMQSIHDLEPEREREPEGMVLYESLDEKLEELQGPEPEIPQITVVPVAKTPKLNRNSLLSALDPKVAAQLSDEDIEEILEEERARAAAESKKKAREDAREQIRHQMRVEHGMLDAATLRTKEQNERLRQKIRIRFDLPSGGSGHMGRNGMRIDGRVFETRQWHTVTVAQFESIREMHYNAWVNETQFTTLDQASRFGITTMNRLQGTTPAKAIYAMSPNMIEVADAEA